MLINQSINQCPDGLWGPTRLHILWSEGLFLRGRVAAARNWPLTSIQFRNAWSLTSTSSQNSSTHNFPCTCLPSRVGQTEYPCHQNEEWEVYYMEYAKLTRFETCSLWLLGAFAILRKTTISFVMSVYLSVRPHGTTRLPVGGFALKSNKNVQYITCRRTYIHDDISLNST